MSLNAKLITMLLFILMLNLASCSKDEENTNNNNNNNNNTNVLRDEALNEYNTNYLASEVTDAQWTGSVSSCNAGTLPQQVHDKVLQRINYFRKVVGLPPVTFNATRNQKCQEAALITLANLGSDHTPAPSSACWTQEGSDGCYVSNLYYTRHTTHAITGYMDDFGPSNQSTGHRHFILLPQTTEMGHGSTNYSNALAVTEDYYDPLPDSLPGFISWPPKNYVPAPLVFDRWSFDVPVDGHDPVPDYSTATVTITDGNGSPVTLDVIHRTDRLVWEPNNINTGNAADVTYHISISGVVVDGNSMNYSYDVIIFQP